MKIILFIGLGLLILFAFHKWIMPKMEAATNSVTKNFSQD